MNGEETRARLREALRRFYESRQRRDAEPAEPGLAGELVRVDATDRGVLLRLTEDLLDELDRGEPAATAEVNHALEYMFDFFQIEDIAEARALVERAVLHPKFRLKARYLQLLGEFADERSAPGLVEVLSRHRGPSEDEIDTRVAALEALHLQPRPLPDPAPVLAMLDDPSSRVRLAAMRYVRAHRVGEAGDLLVRRIPDEDDPDVLALSLEIIEQLGRVDALPVCEELLAGLDPTLSDFVEPLQETIAALRALR